MALELSREEFQLMQQVLERHISNLRAEIAGTENYQWRKDMQADEEKLKSILARLSQAKPADSGDGDIHILVRGFVLLES
jgi:hypothetical protein